jgi:hypothetical protein
MISYQNYINLLKEKNVLLYDFQKRISYSRLNNLLEQKGGDFNNQNGNSNKLISLEKHNLEKVITFLNYKNYDMAKTILEKC